MPPKSPNRSGKSTPTRGRIDKNEEKLQQEEEEQRVRAEKEEQERKLKEIKELKEKERKEKLETIREKEASETFKELEVIRNVLNEVENDRKANSEWERFMRCDGRPDPTSVKEINTFISLEKENGSPDINVVLEGARLILSLIDELNLIIKDFGKDADSDQVAKLRHTVLSLQDLLMIRYDEATLKILKEASYEADSETGNLQKTVQGTMETLMLWGNLNKNPRFKAFEFEVAKVTFELPKILAMSDVAVRVLHTKFDHYSHQCSSYLRKEKKIKAVVEEEAPNPEEENKKEEGEEGENEEKKNEESEKPQTPDGRKSEMSNADSTVKSNEEKEEGEEAKKELKPQTPPPEVAVEEEELEEILDADVVDLRQFSPLGGVYHVDLHQLPPQPNVVNGWTLTQIIDKPLTPITYPSDVAPIGRTQSRVSSAVPKPEEGAEGTSPSKTPLELQQPPIGIVLGLPNDVIFFEEPQVAKWDDKDKHWKLGGITDPNYNEEERTLSFKTSEFGTFSLSQDAHLNMPFQSWELKPKGDNCALLTVTAAIAEAEIEIKGSQCKLISPEEDPPKELSHIFDKWLNVEELISLMRKAGVNIFPEADSSKFVSIQEKKVYMDWVYGQMAALSSGFSLSWSKWNSDGKDSGLILQVAPYVPGNIKSKHDDDWSVYAVTDDLSYKLALSETDDEYSDEIFAEASYHIDLLHAVRMTPLDGDNDGTVLNSLVQKSDAADKVFVNTVYELLKATDVISYS